MIIFLKSFFKTIYLAQTSYHNVKITEVEYEGSSDFVEVTKEDFLIYLLNSQYTKVHHEITKLLQFHHRDCLPYEPSLTSFLNVDPLITNVMTQYYFN